MQVPLVWGSCKWAGWSVTTHPCPFPPSPRSCQPLNKNSVSCSSHAKWIVRCIQSPVPVPLHRGPKTWFHSTAQLSQGQPGSEEAEPIHLLLVKLYNFISLPLAGNTQLTSDTEQAQQVYPAECVSPSSSSNKFFVVPCSGSWQAEALSNAGIRGEKEVKSKANPSPVARSTSLLCLQAGESNPMPKPRLQGDPNL